MRVIGVRFKDSGKIYYFDPLDLNINVDDYLIVETVRGIEYGRCVLVDKDIDVSEFTSPIKPVIRLADAADAVIQRENKEASKEAFIIADEKIKKHGLNMKLIDSEYTFDNNKLIFYFTSDQRVDFRDLVKDLASIFRTRIELRQIGVRDEAKIKGGIGQCGRVCCCKNHMGEFAPVSIKMAKDQGLSLNPCKISGACGRLMCCLNYEEEVYEENLKDMPRVGDKVISEFGDAEVIDRSILKREVKVRILSGDDEGDLKVLPLEEITRVYEKDAKNKSSDEEEKIDYLYEED
ncbi:stage 0 sporulation family protein [Citroniella saccharovorans]|uniref:Stage 0 sporulation family protein n=1 Tax=Citroniella saccharovorans TaxID=2053367 RepID=A0AAW9MZS6_9FIRM|nr:stage 0 sporulation family protein [Citroniella saccharovorans]MEB3430142.1 stage 0 sporulation family protein [Citroniella saccharovorans]